MGALRAVLFDLDGTLADTAPDLARALNRLRAERGLDPMPLASTRRHTSNGARGMLGVGLGLTPVDAGYAGLRERFLDLYEEGLCIETRMFDGIPALLAQLEAGGLPWGIVTNKPKRFTEPLVRRLRSTPRSAPPAS